MVATQVINPSIPIIVYPFCLLKVDSIGLLAILMHTEDTVRINAKQIDLNDFSIFLFISISPLFPGKHPTSTGS